MSPLRILGPGACLVTCLACSRPLAEQLPGEWEVLCRTDSEATTACLGRERELIKRFAADGTITQRSIRGGAGMTGRWTLQGRDLELVFEGGGLRLRERYRARVVDGQLVLWAVDHGFGSILGRVGAAFQPAPGPVAGSAPVERRLGGVRYRLPVPSGHRLGRDDNNRQRWDPPSGEGLQYQITVAPRGRSLEAGRWVVEPCRPRQGPLPLGSSSEQVSGVERKTGVTTIACVEGTELYAMCAASHTRGYLEPAEAEAAGKVCQGLSATR